MEVDVADDESCEDEPDTEKKAFDGAHYVEYVYNMVGYI